MRSSEWTGWALLQKCIELLLIAYVIADAEPWGAVWTSVYMLILAAEAAAGVVRWRRRRRHQEQQYGLTGYG